MDVTNSKPPRRNSGRVAIVAGGVGLAALLLVVGALSQRSDEPDTGIPTDIVALLPEPGAIAFRQDEIGADLRPFLVGTVEIDGREIPEDQITIRELGSARRITFRPGEGFEIVELAPGRHRARIIWWSATEPRPEDDELLNAYAWDFTVE